MAAAAGILLLIKKGGTAIAGLRTAKISFALDGIDISSADDAGIRKFLSTHTNQHFSITASGVEKGGVLATLWTATGTTKYLTDVTFTIPTEASSGDVFTGDVLVTSFDITGEYNGAVMFDCTMESAGSWTAA